jgi:hypothetical protein
MLRIKKEINLKELEKFGFKYKEETNECSEVYEKNTKEGATEVFVWNREIFCQDLDVLWDLIQANLVEKVEE